MDAKLATLGDLTAAWGDGEVKEFKPGARYYEPMDCVIYLKEDVSYSADRIDTFLTLLWHPHENRPVGVKLKGFRWLFQRWQALCRGSNFAVPDGHFVPLVKAIEIALTARLGEILTLAAQADRQEQQAEHDRIVAKYDTAREIVESGLATVDASELMTAA
jgi:hypothetical protein